MITSLISELSSKVLQIFSTPMQKPNSSKTIQSVKDDLPSNRIGSVMIPNNRDLEIDEEKDLIKDLIPPSASAGKE